MSGLTVMSTRLRAAPFLWAAAGLAVAFVAIYLFFVRTYAGQIVDERAFIGANASHDSVVRVARWFLDALPAVALGVGAIVTVIIAVIRRAWKLLVIAAVVVFGANVSTELLKYIFLTRPETGATYEVSNSFPSGHTTVAASVSFAIFLVSAPRLRPVIAVFGWAFSVATGVFTLVSQWHRPSDVIAGYIVVAFWGCIAGAVSAWWGIPFADRQHQSKLSLLWWIALGCAIVSAGAFAMIYATVSNHGSHLEIAYVGGIAAITAVGSAFAAIANRLFRTVG
jgi:membrane-associated phospholipid phosphatase